MLVCVGIAVTPQLSQAEEQQTQPAKLILAPWDLSGLDSEFTRRHETALQALHALSRKLLLPRGQPLTASITRPLLFVEKEEAAQFWVQDAEDGETSVQYQPFLCPIGQELVFGLALLAGDEGYLLKASSFHQALADWQKWRKKTPSAITPPLAAWQQLIEKLQAAPRARHEPQRETFKLALRLLKGSRHPYPASQHCAQQILAESLYEHFLILPQLGLQNRLFVQRFFPRLGPALRHSRVLSIDWEEPRAFPRIQGEARWSEAVFGKNLQPTVPLQLQEQDKKMMVNPEFLSFLNQARASLAPEEWPQVAHIYGAWAYLDRGRAWGLAMNDRMIWQAQGETIKGHVVAFYGPEKKLRSPRGFTIEEGAILFIRKGQKQVKIGDEFRFDPTQFPTPWPPVSQPMATKP